jgi:hypothetical protein
MKRGTGGVYHADAGNPHAELIISDIGEQDGVVVDRVAVLADAADGSGLDTGWNVRDAKRDPSVGGWTPSA